MEDGRHKEKKKFVPVLGSSMVGGSPTGLGRCVRQPRHFDSRRRLMDELTFFWPLKSVQEI